MPNSACEAEVVIVGAGIAGLATAVALHRIGIGAVVLERSDGLRATGAALSLFPNAWLALDALGISHKLNPIYVPLTEGSFTDVQSKRVQEVSLAAENCKGEVSGPRVVHRKALLEALAEELPAGSIRFSSRLTGFETKVDPDSSEPQYTVMLDDGTAINAKVVIGCDGVHSVVARKLGLSSAISSGRWAVRGLAVFAEGHGMAHTVHQFVDAGKRAGCAAMNDKEVYWFLTCKVPENHKDATTDPETIKKQVIEDLARDFPPIYHEVVDHADLTTLSWAPLVFRYPWDMLFGKLADGNVTVAGDAMHPMTPDLGQGGGLALEDAVVLGRHIGFTVAAPGKLDGKKVGQALRGYVRERWWRAAAVITGSYVSGWVQGGGTNWFTRLLRIVFYMFAFKKLVNYASKYDCGELSTRDFISSGV
ncbi:hypothetical protein MLD38_021479 [Melastoma candidum]|uniref:Uncharacterized protein n=1 Tax=Melastoma candidum TaxID=119954 RepID=A0ACB9QHE9_9MYRT|nr:hypothetical protein MLD38_021479 [Melastoma candidum]